MGLKGEGSRVAVRGTGRDGKVLEIRVQSLQILLTGDKKALHVLSVPDDSSSEDCRMARFHRLRRARAALSSRPAAASVDCAKSIA